MDKSCAFGEITRFNRATLQADFGDEAGDDLERRLEVALTALLGPLSFEWASDCSEFSCNLFAPSQPPAF